MQDKDPHDGTETRAEGAAKPGRRRLFGLIGGSALAAGGLFGASAFAQGKTFRHMRLAAFGGGWHRDHKPLGEMTDAEIEAQVTRMVRHLSIEIDATSEQEQKLIAIATTAAKDLRPIRARVRDTAEALEGLLTADTIDRAGIEALRSARLADADRVSKTLADAVADAAEVLSPEQRLAVQQMIAERRDRHRRDHDFH